MKKNERDGGRRWLGLRPVACIAGVFVALSTLVAMDVASAQQQPVTGDMMDSSQPAHGKPRTPSTASAGKAKRVGAVRRPSTQHRRPMHAHTGNAALAAAAIEVVADAIADYQQGDPGVAPQAAPAPLPRRASPQIGDVTHALLQAQVDGSVAGASLPMLGATAGAAYKRYVDSFSHPIPEYFKQTVKDDSGSGS